jgi:hypothetical protein
MEEGADSRILPVGSPALHVNVRRRDLLILEDPGDHVERLSFEVEAEHAAYDFRLFGIDLDERSLFAVLAGDLLATIAVHETSRRVADTQTTPSIDRAPA